MIKGKNVILGLVLSVLVLFGGVAFADSNGVWIKAEDVRAGTFAADENNGDFVFPDNVEINDDFLVNGISTFNSNVVINSYLNVSQGISAQSIWISGDAQIDGDLEVGSNLCLNGDCFTDWNSVCSNWLNNNAIN